MWLSYAYFVTAPAWNQTSRFALTRALIERGSVQIDPDALATGDLARRDGHAYSDKAPGASWLATVPYAAYWLGQRIVGAPSGRAWVVKPGRDELEPLDTYELGDTVVFDRSFRLALTWCTWVAVGLPSTLGVLAFLAWMRARVPWRPAAWLTLTYALATPVFTYSTALYGHAIAAAGVLIGFVGASQTPLPLQPMRRATIVGTALGWAVLAEYPTALLVIAIVALGWHSFGHRFATRVVLAGLPWAVALGLYHHIAFGRPWRLGYHHVANPSFAAMKSGLGFSMPDPTALVQLTFGSYRGLFFVSPVLLLAVWGLARDIMAGPARDRLALGMAASGVAAMVILNSSYYMWDGGSAMGPRHLVPIIGLLALGLRPAIRHAPFALAALAGLSAAHLLLLTAAGPEAPPYGVPLAHALVAMSPLAAGRLSPTPLGVDEATSNLGAWLGLPGAWSLVPLVGLWLLVAREVQSWGVGRHRERSPG